MCLCVDVRYCAAEVHGDINFHPALEFNFNIVLFSSARQGHHSMATVVGHYYQSGIPLRARGRHAEAHAPLEVVILLGRDALRHAAGKENATLPAAGKYR